MTLLRVSHLSIKKRHGADIVTDVEFDIDAGERVGLIGESGSGKSLTALGIMGLLPEGIEAHGSIGFADRELLDLTDKDLCDLRGNEISMIFQEPMSALNPLMRIGKQIAEAWQIHGKGSKRASKQMALDLLEKVGFDDPPSQFKAYPHQLSGGQRQRVMIAIAIACTPRLVLADEPTTSLDVTTQAQVMRLLGEMVGENGAALLLISHDLGVVSLVCDRILVMYGGEILESGSTTEIIRSPLHPYTVMMLETAEMLESSKPQGIFPVADAEVDPGYVAPMAGDLGCVYWSRCPRRQEKCKEKPVFSQGTHPVKCWFPHGTKYDLLTGDDSCPN